MATSKGKGDVREIENMLRRFDSETVMAAIMQADVLDSEVKEIKSYLSKFSTATLQSALEEMKTEAMNVEIRSVSEVISKFGIAETKMAAANIGIADRAALCIDAINCRSNCVMVMVVRCGQEMVALTARGELVQQHQLERGIAHATAMAKKMEEF